MTNHSIEERDQQQRRAMQVFLVAFCLWQIPALVNELGGLSAGLRGALGAGAALGGTVWVVCMFRLHRLQAAIHADPVLREALNDERIRVLRLKAFNVGFFSLIAYLGFLRLGAAMVSIPTAFAAQLGIFVAVVVTVSALLVYDRSEP
jgi:hypothetical protein